MGGWGGEEGDFGAGVVVVVVGAWVRSFVRWLWFQLEATRLR